MKHNVTIDRLRGLSVLVVVCMHYAFFFRSVLPFLGRAIGNGYYGVTAFFCISGFLITTNILKRYGELARVDMYAFYVMRFGRIVPPLSLLLLVLSLLSLTALKWFHLTAPLSLQDTLLSIVTLRYNRYYQQGGAVMYVWAVLWSLSIEEMFYLVYPLMAKLTRITTVLAVILVALVVYAPLHRHPGLMTIYDYFGCFDAIALGALTALAAKRFAAGVARGVSWALLLSGAALAGWTYAETNVNTQYNLGLSLIGLSAAIILFASQCAPFAGTRRWAFDPLAYVGELSYEMYLFHMTIYALFSLLLVPRYVKYPRLDFAVIFLCVVAVSDLINRFYAGPLNAWLRATLLSGRRPRVPHGRCSGRAASNDSSLAPRKAVSLPD